MSEAAPIAPEPTAPSVDTSTQPCGGCRGQQQRDEAAQAETKKTLGLVSFVAAKTGEKVADHVRKLRFSLCRMCKETEKGNDVLLRREVNGKLVCGVPRLSDITKIYRDETAIGCGCDLEDKTQWDKAQCPRGRWGPGPYMGKQFKMEYRKTQVLKDVIDVQVHYQMRPNEETDMTGIGDTVQALPVVHALAKKYPNKQVRIRAVDHRVQWARIGWPNVVPLGDFSTRGEWVVKLYPHRMLDIDRWCLMHKEPTSRIQICARAAGVTEIPRDIGISSNEEKRRWGASQFSEAKGKPVVCLAPFANCTQRTWPFFRWVDLAEKLKNAGCFVYIMDGNDPDRTKYMPYLRYWGWDAEHTVALLENTSLLIGNDSGMVHLAGIMRRPALALCGVTSGQVVFGWYDTVKFLQAQAKCTGCRWEESRGYRQACNFTCEALLGLTSDTVLTEAIGMLEVKR